MTKSMHASRVAVNMPLKATHLATLASLIFLLHPHFCHADEEEHVGDEPHLATSHVWGYSILFNFLACLPSACAIIVCVWAKLTIADKAITALMAFASGVSVRSIPSSASSALKKPVQVLIGGSLFHLLPDIAEGSNSELNRGLTCIILVVISLMFMIDSHASMKRTKNTNVAAKCMQRSKCKKFQVLQTLGCHSTRLQLLHLQRQPRNSNVHLSNSIIRRIQLSFSSRRYCRT